MWWILGVIVLVVIVVALLFRTRSSNNAVGYTRGYGYCPNMGACDGCDVCQED